MPLDAITHTFAGSPLDRASDKRADDRWIAAQLEDPAARLVALSDGKPLVADAEGDGLRLVYLTTDEARFAGFGDGALFLGLADDVPIFAVELDGANERSAGAARGL